MSIWRKWDHQIWLSSARVIRDIVLNYGYYSSLDLSQCNANEDMLSGSQFIQVNFTETAASKCLPCCIVLTFPKAKIAAVIFAFPTSRKVGQ